MPSLADFAIVDDPRLTRVDPPLDYADLAIFDVRIFSHNGFRSSSCGASISVTRVGFPPIADALQKGVPEVCGSLGTLQLAHTSLVRETGVHHNMSHWKGRTWPFLILTACACAVATPEVASQTALPTFSTNKPPQVFAKCLETAFGPVQAVRFGVRAAITSKSGLEIDVFDGGTVRVRRPLVLDSDTRRRLEACL